MSGFCNEMKIRISTTYSVPNSSDYTQRGPYPQAFFLNLKSVEIMFQSIIKPSFFQFIRFIFISVPVAHQELTDMKNIELVTPSTADVIPLMVKKGENTYVRGLKRPHLSGKILFISSN